MPSGDTSEVRLWTLGGVTGCAEGQVADVRLFLSSLIPTGDNDELNIAANM